MASFFFRPPSPCCWLCFLGLLPCLQVNSDPFGEGWMIKVKLADEGELAGLMESKAYTDFCESGAH